MSLRSLVSLSTFVALTCGLAHAGVITGQMIDSQGHPVHNAVLAFTAMHGGAHPVVTGGVTDANGMFTTTITPNGSYRMTVFPLPPPQSLVVTRRIDDIAIGATVNNLGTLELQVGFALSGRAVNVVGTPLVNVGLEFVAAPDFERLDFVNGNTDALGHFNVSVPWGEVEMDFESGIVPYYGGPSTAPTSREYEITGSLDVGDVVLPSGTGLSGLVLKQSNNSAVADADIEVVQSSTGQSVYTGSNPRTSSLGAYSVILPAGTYDFHIMPREHDGLAPATILNRTVPPGGSLGTTLLSPGVDLDGSVLDSNGAPRGGVRVGLVNTTTNAKVFVADNLTAVDGSYKVTVPTGTFDVTFSAPYTIPFGTATYPNVPISQNTSQDGTLPALQLFTTVGAGTPGQGGFIPQISAAGGTPRTGNLGYTVVCANGCGGSLAMLGTWIGTRPTVFPGSRLAAVPMHLNFLQLNGAAGVAGAGSAMFSLPIPSSSVLVGQQIRARFVVLDAAAAHGHASTQELRATISP